MSRTRSTEKQDNILDAVPPLVAANGYMKTRIEHVAAAAGVGKQTIYRWWPTKADLVADAYIRLVPENVDTTEDAAPLDALEQLLKNVFRLYRDTPAAAMLSGLIADAQSEPGAAEALRANLLVGRRHLVLSPIRRAEELGHLADGTDIQAAADLIISAVWHRVLTDPASLTDDFAAELLARTLPRRDTSRLTIRDYFPGALGDVCSLQSKYYAREWGFGRGFEVDRAAEMSEFIGRFDPESDVFKLVCREDQVVGAIAIDGGSEENPPGAALLRWFIVADGERGSGVGRGLLALAVEFARKTRYDKIHLHTFAGLESARHLYEGFGFNLMTEAPSDRWGVETIQQTFELALTDRE